MAADITEGASAAILIGAAAANLAETGVAEGFLTNTQAATLNLTESTLVALSAIYDIVPEIVRKDDLFRKAMAGVLDPMTKGEVELIVG